MCVSECEHNQIIMCAVSSWMVCSASMLRVFSIWHSSSIQWWTEQITSHRIVYWMAFIVRNGNRAKFYAQKVYDSFACTRWPKEYLLIFDCRKYVDSKPNIQSVSTKQRIYNCFMCILYHVWVDVCVFAHM